MTKNSNDPISFVFVNKNCSNWNLFLYFIRSILRIKQLSRIEEIAKPQNLELF